MADDVITLIIRDHRELDELFDRLLKSTGDERVQLTDRIGDLLIAHSRAEEDRVYPRIAQVAPSEKGEVHHGVEEHHEAEELLRKLQGMRPDDAQYESAAHELVDAVRHHIEEEETDILPTLEDSVEPNELEQLGRAFAERRQQGLVSTAADRSGGATSSAGSSVGSSGDEPTKQELYEEAKRQDVPGRSKMTKDELARAVEES